MKERHPLSSFLFQESEAHMIKAFGTPVLADALKRAQRVLLCTHINPDGDAVGSTLAMGLALEGMGKEVTLCCADPVPGKLMFLRGAEKFVQPDALAGREFDLAFAVDAADEMRMGAAAQVYFAAPDQVQVDHHPTNPLYARLNAVDGDAAAAGCVVYRLLKHLGVEITQDIAKCLYCAISTDTGNFSFENTDDEAFSIVAELVKAGLPLNEMSRKLFLLQEEAHVRLLGRALNTLRLFGSGRCACMQLTPADYQAAGAGPEHSDGIVNYAMNLWGVQMAYLADEKEDGTVKVSLRALPPYNVARVAQKFGGGGHVLASGCRYAAKLEEMCAALEKEMESQLEENA